MKGVRRYASRQKVLALYLFSVFKDKEVELVGLSAPHVVLETLQTKFY